MADDQTTLLYWTDEDSGRVEFVEFDAVIALTPEDVSTLTTHPVERGVNVADHVRDEPDRLTIEALVSRTPNVEVDSDAALAPLDVTIHAIPAGRTKTIPLEIPSPPIQPDLAGLVTAGVNAIGSAITGGPSATVNEPADAKAFQFQARAVQQSSPRNRIRDVYEKLLGARAKRSLLTVLTRDREYQDMQITRIAAPRASDTGATRFEIDLERLRVADTETVQAPQPAEIRGAGKKNKGSQATKPSENTQQIESTLSQGAGAFGLT